MSTLTQKVIKPKLGLLELAKQLGNVSQACKVMGIAEIHFIVSLNFMNLVVKPHYKKSVVKNQSLKIEFLNILKKL